MAAVSFSLNPMEYPNRTTSALRASSCSSLSRTLSIAMTSSGSCSNPMASSYVRDQHESGASHCPLRRRNVSCWTTRCSGFRTDGGQPHGSGQSVALPPSCFSRPFGLVVLLHGRHIPGYVVRILCLPLRGDCLRQANPCPRAGPRIRARRPPAARQAQVACALCSESTYFSNRFPVALHSAL